MLYFVSEGGSVANFIQSIAKNALISKYGMGMVPSIIDVWGYDREFYSSFSSSSS